VADAVVFAGVIYFPEVSTHSNHRRGRARCLDWLYVTGLCVVLLLSLRFVTPVPLAIHLVLAGVLLVWLVIMLISPSKPTRNLKKRAVDGSG
jgi:hypothetical protein